MRIVINGIGIAGPSIAYWLQKAGHEVLLVEKAPQLRRGGYIIDFWGRGYDIVEKMGILPSIKKCGYQVQEVRFVDKKGRKTGGFSADVFTKMTHDRFTSVLRSDLSAQIVHDLEGKVKKIFGDSIAKVTDLGDHLNVDFDHAASQKCDLVIGADGLHSRVRQLTFGPESDFEVATGYHVAAFEVEGYTPRDELVYVSHGIPGRQISRFSMRHNKTMILFVIQDKYITKNKPNEINDYKEILFDTFNGVGWEEKSIFAALEKTNEIYFDKVSQIRMAHWTKGKVALIGDAAACVSLLAGEGAGLAITEAFVLASELTRHNNNYTDAFKAYEQKMMPFILHKQESALKFATSFAPKTTLGINFRDIVTHFLHIPFIGKYFAGRAINDDIVLDEYGL